MDTNIRTTRLHLLTVPEAAAELRISEPTAYRLIRMGQLPALRVGGQIRIDGAELDDWLHADQVVRVVHADPGEEIR